jgi:hypothetical protein
VERREPSRTDDVGAGKARNGAEAVDVYQRRMDEHRAPFGTIHQSPRGPSAEPQADRRHAVTEPTIVTSDRLAPQESPVVGATRTASGLNA